jgi:DNA invertase Pin-like site-specific DNA recombinase
MPTAIYVRISNDQNNMRAGVERQIADCEAIIRQRGWAPPVRYEDNDVSAWSGKRRPGFEQMMLDMGGLDAIVAWDIDRLFRQPRDLERFIDRCDKVGMHRVVTAQGDIDLTSSDGRLRARIMGAVAVKESDDKSRRIKRALKDRSEQGKWHGSRPPFGYQFDGEGSIEPALVSADIVVDGYAHIIDGGSIRHLVGKYAASGAPTTQQGWRSLLLSPTMVGQTSDGSEGQWEPIISHRTWFQVKMILEAPERRKHRGTARVHWLKGILFCGKCGATMAKQSGWHADVKSMRWACAKCRGITIAAAPVEEFLEAAIFESAPMIAASARPQTPELSSPEGGEVFPLGVQRQDIEQRQIEAARQYAWGKTTLEMWEAQNAIFVEQLAALSKHLDAPTPTPIPTEQEWASWSPTRKFEAAHGLLGRVVVLPGRSTNVGDRLTIEWVR